MEYFRLDDSGRLNDTQERLTSRGYGGDDSDNPFSALPILVRAPEGPSGFGFSGGYQSGPFFNEAARTRRPGARPRRSTAAPTSRHYSRSRPSGLRDRRASESISRLDSSGGTG